MKIPFFSKPDVADIPEMLIYRSGDYIVTGEVFKSGPGYSLELWVSGNFEGELRMMGTFSCPIYGDTLADARNRFNYLLDDLFAFILRAFGGDGVIHKTPAEDKKTAIAVAHLMFYIDAISSLPALDRTLAMYSFLTQLKVKDVAVLIAEIENVKSVRTIHDRILKLRKAGRLASLGKGRTY